jgi:hypothetical protein
MGLSVIMLNIGMYLGVPAVVIVGIRKNLWFFNYFEFYLHINYTSAY